MGWKWTQVDISRLRAAEMIFSSHMEGKTKTHPERERDKIKKNVYVDKLTNNKIRRYMDILKKIHRDRIAKKTEHETKRTMPNRVTAIKMRIQDYKRCHTQRVHKKNEKLRKADIERYFTTANAQEYYCFLNIFSSHFIRHLHV